MSLSIRPLTKKDIQACAQLFYETVHTVNKQHYSPEQLKVWAPDIAQFSIRFENMLENSAWVVEDQGQIVGFGDMTHQGYIDRLYVHKDFQRKGIARLIFSKWLAYAKEHKLKELTTEASITAKPAAEALGFKVITEQIVVINGQQFVNYKMVYSL
ncbi:TPA: GNAT family N-acetyltransferase [Legionella pneumophila]